VRVPISESDIRIATASPTRQIPHVFSMRAFSYGISARARVHVCRLRARARGLACRRGFEYTLLRGERARLEASSPLITYIYIYIYIVRERGLHSHCYIRNVLPGFTRMLHDRTARYAASRLYMCARVISNMFHEHVSRRWFCVRVLPQDGPIRGEPAARGGPGARRAHQHRRLQLLQGARACVCVCARARVRACMRVREKER
jgi:hypothetical protein